MDEQRLRALASAASIGPWSVHGNNCDEWYVYALHARYETLPGNPSPVKVAWVPWSPGTPRHEHDAAYIAAVSPDVLLALLDERDALTRERDDLLASGRFELEMYDKVRAERDALGRERDCAYAAQRAAETELALQAAQAVAREGDLRYQRDAAAALLREARDWIVSVDRADAGRRQIPIVARIDALLGGGEGA